MAGIGDNASLIEDWAPNPSPRTFLSNFLNEEFGSRSFSNFLGENGSEGPKKESDKRRVSGLKEEDGGGEIHLSGDHEFKLNPFSVRKSSLHHGGLAERVAARAGFSAPKINTAGIRSANMSSSQSEIRSPYLTIPPGLSPTTLLDSPVFLSNSMAQPSPTTGQFLFAQGINTYSGSAVPDENKDHSFEDMALEPFAFKPHPESSSSCFSSVENKRLANIQVSVQSDHPLRAGPVNLQNQQDFSLQSGFSNSSERKDADDDITLNHRVSDTFMADEQSPPLDQPDGEADQRGELSSAASGAPAEDGYNWRKYGQKQVKGSEYPRSYYKCTHVHCPVKKKVERSHDGHITEIIYKGAHSHPKPPLNRRSGTGHPFNDPQFDGSEHPGPQAGYDWRGDGLEATSGTTELCDSSIPVRAQDGPQFESPEALDMSSTLSNDEDEDDQVTHCSTTLGGDGGEGDEMESKRRKMDASTVEISAASRAVREPRVVVQTTSEVDILDDGYRWRKYGQKVVKGNPNPRSYYKCTNPGCMVRKHVERASHDLKSVITTYEGKHSHDVPAARNNSSHASSLASSTTSTSVSQSRGLQSRQDPSHDGLIPMGSFSLPGPGYGFRMMPQQGLNLGLSGLAMAPMKMPAFPPAHSFMGMRQNGETRFMMPKGEMKEEPLSEAGLMMPSRGSVYHQMMGGRLPLGPQL